MRELLSLKDIQNISLEIMLDVHAFCADHSIKYSLAYGTLIGAMRHKGFIPWDDDIDIYMLRPDFERFCKTYKSEGKLLVAPCDSFIDFARVCDMEKTVCQDLLPWSPRKDTGCWIDIFPVDTIEDDRQKFSAKIEQLSYLLDKQVKGRSALASISVGLPFSRKVKLLARKVLYSHISLSRVNACVMQIVNQTPWGSTAHCSQLVCGGNKAREFFTYDMFKSTVEVDFEGHKLWVANGWEDILRLNYGDYMKLPPLEDRKPKQSNYLKIFWK